VRDKFYSLSQTKHWSITLPRVSAFLKGNVKAQVGRQRRRSQVSKAYVPNSPGERLFVDLTDIKRKECNFLLSVTVVDGFSGKLVCIPGKINSAKFVADKFGYVTLPQFCGGQVKQCRSDNGGEFKGEFADMLARLNIKQILTQPHQPQGNRAETAKRVMKTMFTSAENQIDGTGYKASFMVALRKSLKAHNHAVTVTGFQSRAVEQS
jgi:hypothetical protein